jgi:tetratricopeptide (TPR) repeat protein
MELSGAVIIALMLFTFVNQAAGVPPVEITPEELAAAFWEAVNTGDGERALEIATEAGNLDPDNVDWVRRRGAVLVELGRYGEAEEVFLYAVARGDESATTFSYLVLIELKKDTPDLEAAKKYEKRYEQSIKGWYTSGDPIGDRRSERSYNLASIYIGLGEADIAFEYLERALTDDPSYVEKASEDPNLDSLRDDPRYTELAAEAEGNVAESIATYATVPPGEPAPEFVLLDVDGNTVKLSDYHGKVLLVNFWTTWCLEWAEIPYIAELYDEYKDKGLVVLGIFMDGVAEEFTMEDLTAISAELGVNYPVLLGTKSVAEAYISKTYGIPETYIVDQFGTVVEFIYGVPDKEILERKILKYLP